MFGSTKRSLRNITGILRSGKPLNKQRLVAYRARASDLAKQRENELKRLFGPHFHCYVDIYFHECAYYMANESWLALKKSIRKQIYATSLIYGCLSLAAFYFLLFQRFSETLSLDFHGLPFSFVVFIIFAIIGSRLTLRFVTRFRAEFCGLGDRIRSDDLRRPLYAFSIGSGIYFFGFGIASSLESDWNTGFALLLGAIGALGMSVCFATWICVAGINCLNRSITNQLKARFPVEVILHELISSVFLLRTTKKKRLSFRMQRKWHRHIELAASAVEVGLLKQLAVEDRFSSSQIASRLGGIANGFRDLKIWLATPQPDTYIHLEHRLVATINDVADGNWDLLPMSSRPLPKAPLIKDVFVTLFFIVLAVGLSGLFAWLAGILFKTSSAYVPSFAAVLPVITTSLFGLINPGLSARRLAGK